MTSYLDELYTHQEWADAEHWRVVVEDYADMADLKTFARKTLAELATMMRGMDEARLAEMIEVPWFSRH
jgi:hypothetical protein